MSPERLAFLRAIAARPDDVTAGLVFADWLQENGEDWSALVVRMATSVEVFTLYAETTVTFWWGPKTILGTCHNERFDHRAPAT